MKEIIISVDEFENRVAIHENDVLKEYHVSRGEKKVGSIYKGTVMNVLPGMQAAFVDIGLEKNAFLCADDIVSKFNLDEDADIEKLKEKSRSIKDVLKAKEELLVQVVKESTGGKGNRVTTLITLPGRYMVFMPFVNYTGISRKIENEEERARLMALGEKIKPKEMGIIIRTAAEGKSVRELRSDLALLLKLWNKIKTTTKRKKAPSVIHEDLSLVYRIIRDVFTKDVDRLVIDSKEEYEKVLDLLSMISPGLKNRVRLYEGDVPVFEHYGIEPKIDKALRRRVWLPSGGYIIIDKTEALTVIDVNTGKYIGKSNVSKTILKTNLEAALEIARQIRLRDIAGIIIIDFIDMYNQENKDKLLAELAKHFKEDRVRANIVGMTELGLVQVTRKRTGKELNEILKEICPCCSGRGQVLSAETLSINLNRMVKRRALEENVENIIVKATPNIALKFLGWEAEDVERLEKIIGKNIYLRADTASRVEKFDVEPCSSALLKDKISFLMPGSEIKIKLEEICAGTPANAIVYYEGNIIEVHQGANRVGQTLDVIITFVSRSYAQGQIKD